MRISAVLADCPEDLVDILMKRIVDGESVEKIAEQTGKSITTIISVRVLIEQI